MGSLIAVTSDKQTNKQTNKQKTKRKKKKKKQTLFDLVC